MQEQTQKIACPICRRANFAFKSLTDQINHARAPREKAPYARQLIAKVEAVLQEHGPADDPIAKGCQTVLAIRKKTAELILKAEKLD